MTVSVMILPSRTPLWPLKKVGDVSEPVVGSYGVHILHYLRDIPGGAVELTDDMKEEFRETILHEMISEALHSAVDQWMEEAEIVYSEAGEDWKLPVADDGDEEDAEETAPAEETSEVPAAVLPAE